MSNFQQFIDSIPGYLNAGKIATGLGIEFWVTQANAQYVYGERLQRLFGVTPKVTAVTNGDPDRPPVIHFMIPTDTNFACLVEVTVHGVKDGWIDCSMTVNELNRQEELDRDFSASGI